MSEPTPTPSRQLWLIIWGALTLAPIAYVIVGSQVTHVGEPPPPWSAASLAAMLGVVLPGGLSYWRRWEASASRTTPKAIG